MLPELFGARKVGLNSPACGAPAILPGNNFAFFQIDRKGDFLMKRILIFLLALVMAGGLFVALPTSAAGENVFATATWNKGAFYDTEKPNTNLASTRRYTVIPCEWGDSFNITMPSPNWHIYAYPADEKGSIDGKWVELTNGSRYVIKPINGRKPTSLRITVCPRPDGILTDAMWETFDAVCKIEKGTLVLPETAKATDNLFDSADWKNGSYYGNAVHGGADRRHAVFPCIVNDTFTFDFNGTEFGLWIYYYDKDGEIADLGYTTVTKDTEIKIVEKNGRTPSELRISVYPIAGGDITDAMWEKFDVSCTRSSDLIRVATMNYGLWNDGVTKFVPDDKVDTVLAAWKKMLDDHDVDILAGQEWLEYFDRSNNLTVADYLFGYKYPYQYSTARGYGKNLVSKTECTDYQDFVHSNLSGRMYTVAYTVINGKKVCLINAHLSLENDFNISRKSEYQNLLDVMKKQEYVIVFGDFNAYTTSEFDVFKEAGFSLVNGGKFGTFNTWTNFDKPSSWKNKAIDNIIVSSNIEVLGARVDRRDLSDHSMLVADLLVGATPETDDPGSTDSSTSDTSGTSDVLTTDTSGTSTDTSGTSDVTDVTDTSNPVDTSGTTSQTDTFATDAPGTASVTDGEDTSSSGLLIGWIVGIVAAVAVAVGLILFLKKKKA